MGWDPHPRIDAQDGQTLEAAADIIGVTVLFPGAIFAMAGGAIFGIGYGSLLVWIATSLGQTLAFIVGRYMLRGMVVAYLSSRFPKWAAVDAALSNEGWKLITLLRLSPIVPWNVLNYALSVTGVGLLPYALSSSVAIVPWSITFVYFGSMAKNMADILEGRAGPHGASSVALLAMSGVMLVAVVVYSTIIARRAIREALSKGGNSTDEELQSIVVSSTDNDEGNNGAKGMIASLNGLNSESSGRRNTATER
ncbi:hypothetical protein COCSUDRAFT_68258 [Coccomyxa subellipsoidea C-169]|uniref:VTT domain-containing protein n=1 Tax=Coccomyxa subellipsoidea (strain C-169) TaxID=574566 RepID=I0YJI0_COCSC|nr:hypothetical protein COCSUDRAFT_68258 [Coccomyxa subellipsoidea C-169]EIE18549.1 hypothetical protein COCSUDRAFT_68258 [Coccomyxa subellipsoidea C-169]|eukprot:XP_005643093.1 hypothetical protein COCSUDRAFT_68258 [Coccomyxa subellipsoidea C-169]